MKNTVRRFLALSLIACNGLLLLAAGAYFWTVKNQELPSLPVPSAPRGTADVLRFLSIFPWEAAIAVSCLFLLPAATIYPWPRRQPAASAVPAEPGDWPPPPVSPEQPPIKKPIRHWAHPDTGDSDQDLMQGN